MESTSTIENIITFNDEEIEKINTSNIISTDKYSYNPRSIKCTQSGEEFHSATDVNVIGFRSIKLDLWFSSKFNYNLYCYENHLCHYKDAEKRTQDANIFSKYTVKNG